jgi:hypothetical protein
MPTSPADLRALAARCCAGETTDELRDAVLIALGWGVTFSGGLWVSPDSEIVDAAPNPLTDINASAAAMPAGWRIIKLMEQVGWGFSIEVWKQGYPIIWVRPSADLPAGLTERHARTAAALMARAAEEEQKEGERC